MCSGSELITELKCLSKEARSLEKDLANDQRRHAFTAQLAQLITNVHAYLGQDTDHSTITRALEAVESWFSDQAHFLKYYEDLTALKVDYRAKIANNASCPTTEEWSARLRTLKACYPKSRVPVEQVLTNLYEAVRARLLA